MSVNELGVLSRLLMPAIGLLVVITGAAAAEQLNESFRRLCVAQFIYTSAEAKPAVQAIPLISEALALDPTLTWGYFNRGVYELQRRDRRSAC